MNIFLRIADRLVILFQKECIEENSVSDTPEAPQPTPARRDRSIAARRKSRQGRLDRERRIMFLLNCGASMGEMAADQGVSLKRMRNLVRESLATRMPRPPAEYLALQISRLNEALLVSYTAMHKSVSGTNFEAVDRVVRIVRELDRYHGFAPGEAASRAERPQLAAPAQAPLALAAPGPSDSGLAPQLIENAQFGLGNGEPPLSRARVARRRSRGL